MSAAPLLLAGALLAHAAEAPPASALRARAAQAFAAGKAVAEAVPAAELQAARKATAAQGPEREALKALEEGLPLALAVQSAKEPPPEAVTAAARRLGADEAACLCLYTGKGCPPGQEGQKTGGNGATRTLPSDKQVASWKAYGASLFEEKGDAGGLPAGWSSGAKPGTSPFQDRPAAQLPSGFKTSAQPPPLTGSDRVVNSVLSVANQELYSRAGTLNRESKEGSRKAICGFLQQAGWDPGEAWRLSKAARDKKGADPGDLDLRNAEHYLYAYSTTNRPSGWTDSVPVQVVMAIGWTPFKTVTKHFRPTSTPSTDEMGWGVDGALDGWRQPDWKARCASGK